MKTTNPAGRVLCAALLLFSLPAAAGNPAISVAPPVCICPEPPTVPGSRTECWELLSLESQDSADSPAEKLARIDARIRELSLELNRLVWETYLDYAAEVRVAPAVLNYPGLDYRALCDTVPEIAALDRQYREASDAYTEILKSDPKYDAVHREYVALKDVDDKARQNANREQYNLMYDRLRRKDRRYTPALEARQAAVRARNMAVTRFLLAHYQAQGRVMPTEPLFKNYSDTMRAVRSRVARIGEYESELSILLRLRREVFEQVLRERYDVPGKHADDGSVVGGLAQG